MLSNTLVFSINAQANKTINKQIPIDKYVFLQPKFAFAIVLAAIEPIIKEDAP